MPRASASALKVWSGTAQRPVRDVLIEVWQANAASNYADNVEGPRLGRVIYDFDTGVGFRDDPSGARTERRI